MGSIGGKSSYVISFVMIM